MMTIEKYDAADKKWVEDETGIAYSWTGWKRKYDPRLMTSLDPDIPLDPIDDTLAGQWVAQSKDRKSFWYSSYPGASGPYSRGTDMQVEPCPDFQVQPTTDSSEKDLETYRYWALEQLHSVIAKSLALVAA